MNSIVSDKLSDVLASISSKAGERVTLDSLLDDWEAFVRDLEQCYRLGAYDYVESLFVRDYLQEIISAVEPATAREIQALVKPSDDRFRLATQKIPRAVVEPANTPNFWWFRVPRNLSDTLAADLRAEGTIK